MPELNVYLTTFGIQFPGVILLTLLLIEASAESVPLGYKMSLSLIIALQLFSIVLEYLIITAHLTTKKEFLNKIQVSQKDSTGVDIVVGYSERQMRYFTGIQTFNLGSTYIMKSCYTCRIIRPPLSYHCHFCDYCVLDADHHCSYLSCCIGKMNYRYFICLVSVLNLLFILIVSCSLYKFFLSAWTVGSCSDNCGIQISYLVLLPFIVITLTPIEFLLIILILLHVYLYWKNLTTSEWLKNRQSNELRSVRKNKIEEGARQLVNPQKPIVPIILSPERNLQLNKSNNMTRQNTDKIPKSNRMNEDLDVYYKNESGTGYSDRLFTQDEQYLDFEEQKVSINYQKLACDLRKENDHHSHSRKDRISQNDSNGASSKTLETNFLCKTESEYRGDSGAVQNYRKLRSRSRPRRSCKKQKDRFKHNKSLKNETSLNLDPCLSEEYKSVRDNKAFISVPNLVNHIKNEKQLIDDHSIERDEDLSNLKEPAPPHKYSNIKVNMKFALKDEFYPQSLIFRRETPQYSIPGIKLCTSQAEIIEMKEDNLSELKSEEDP